MPIRFKYNVLTGKFDLVMVADDTAYGIDWDGSTEAPTQNAVYDKIESLVAGTDDGAKKLLWIMAG